MSGLQMLTMASVTLVAYVIGLWLYREATDLYDRWKERGQQ